MKKCLFYCDTPFQIFTTVSLLQGHFSDWECDLVLYHKFFNSERMRLMLNEVNLFNRIYDAYPANSKKSDIKRLISCTSYIRQEIGLKDLYYDQYLFSMLDTNASLALYSGLKYAEVSTFDDGCENYRDRDIYDYVNWRRHLILKIFHPQKKYFHFDSTYCYLPEICTTDISQRIKIKISSTSIYDKVFNYIPNDLYNRKFVYFDSPVMYNHRDYFETELKRVLNDIQQDLTVRLHPRMKKTTLTESNIDKGLNVWEVECMHQITNNHVLISTYSTAMFTPIMIAECSPTLIFLYKLTVDMFTAEMLKGIETHISRFKKIYSKSLVYIPEDWNELDFIIKQL